MNLCKLQHDDFLQVRKGRLDDRYILAWWHYSIICIVQYTLVISAIEVYYSSLSTHSSSLRLWLTHSALASTEAPSTDRPVYQRL